jgi:hypothetical protein
MASKQTSEAKSRDEDRKEMKESKINPESASKKYRVKKKR